MLKNCHFEEIRRNWKKKVSKIHLTTSHLFVKVYLLPTVAREIPLLWTPYYLSSWKGYCNIHLFFYAWVLIRNSNVSMYLVLHIGVVVLTHIQSQSLLLESCWTALIIFEKFSQRENVLKGTFKTMLIRRGR